MTEFKKLTAYSDAKCEWVSSTYPYDKENAQLRAENAKLRELVARMAEALGIDCEWADPNWCKSPCVLEFGCWPEGDHAEIRCPAWATMRELGIEVD